MIKTLLAADRSEREHFRIPRSVQQSIPVQKIYRDGIWQVGGGKYSRTWRFADINYALASHEDHVLCLLRCAEQSAHRRHYEDHHQQPAAEWRGLSAQYSDAGAWE